MKLLSVSQMIAIEKEANAAGLSYEQMMENAGRGLADAILDVYGYMEQDGVLALVGSGNNGGDALVALTHLAEAGWKCSAYLVRPRQDDPLAARLVEAGGVLYGLQDDPHMKKLDGLLGENGLLLDGVLGTGFRLPLKDELAGVLGFVRQRVQSMDYPPCVVAVDCPSGVDCDSGQAAAECIPAERTVTMAAVKQGLFKFPAYTLVGDLQVVGIGLPQEGEGLQAWRAVQCSVPDEEWVRQALPARPLDAHKGTFGAALVVAGSASYTGAALLAGEAAYRIGAGLVTLGAPEPLHAPLAGKLPEATWLLLPHEDGFIEAGAADLVLNHLERVTALLLGPGLGLENTTAAFVARLLAGPSAPGGGQMGFIKNGGQKDTVHADLPPLVIDADGLKLLARLPKWHTLLPAPAVLTPHPGEMSVLTGLSTGEIQNDRLEIARRYSQEWGHVIVLKGAFSVIAAPDGRSAVIPVASPALARAGTGDVLAGLIVGLRAQGLGAFESAAAGAWLHAYAGLYAAQSLGSSAAVLAGDVLRAVVEVLAELQ